MLPASDSLHTLPQICVSYPFLYDFSLSSHEVSPHQLGVDVLSSFEAAGSLAWDDRLR